MIPNTLFPQGVFINSVNNETFDRHPGPRPPSLCELACLYSTVFYCPFSLFAPSSSHSPEPFALASPHYAVASSTASTQ